MSSYGPCKLGKSNRKETPSWAWHRMTTTKTRIWKSRRNRTKAKHGRSCLHHKTLCACHILTGTNTPLLENPSISYTLHNCAIHQKDLLSGLVQVVNFFLQPSVRCQPL